MAGNQSDSRDDLIPELFRKYGSLMYDIAFSILQQEQSAEDAVQETLLKLWERQIDTEETEARTVRTLLIVMTRNTALDIRRKLQHQISMDMNREETQMRLGMTSGDDRIRESHELARCFRLLDDAEQEILWMKYWESLTHRQIGKRLGISEYAAAARLKRAKARLKALLTGEEESNE